MHHDVLESSLYCKLYLHGAASWSVNVNVERLLVLLFRAVNALEARDAKARSNLELAVIVLDAQRPVNQGSVKPFKSV